MNLARTDANLGAESELSAIIEARRGIDHHGRRVDPVDKLSGSSIIRRNDRFGVFRAVLFDMSDRLVDVFDHSNGKNQIEVLSRPVLLVSLFDAGNQRTGFLTAANLYARRAGI